MQPVAVLIGQREEHGIPPLKRYFIMFVRGHTVLFLHLFYLGSEERHKATTPNCGSLEKKVYFFLRNINDMRSFVV